MLYTHDFDDTIGKFVVHEYDSINKIPFVSRNMNLRVTYSLKRKFAECLANAKNRALKNGTIRVVRCARCGRYFVDNSYSKRIFCVPCKERID